MTIVIETVPESIPFERVQELVHALGMDTRDLISFRLDPRAVTAEVRALNADGHPYVVGYGGGDVRLATHQIVIPITRS